MATSIDHLRQAGLLGAAEPTALYREWVWWTLPTVSGPRDVVARAQQEGVEPTTFEALEALTVWRAPSLRPYVRISAAASARHLSRVTELLNGGRPSTTNRRERNAWTYRGPLGLTTGDVGLILRTGGAVVATPGGTMMAAAGPKIGPVPNAVDMFTARAGTTWGDVFVVNGSNDQPARVLSEAIESGRAPRGSAAPSLHRLLRHEKVHSEQWARYGFVRFIWAYLVRHNPNDPCRHPLEQEAGLADGGYRC